MARARPVVAVDLDEVLGAFVEALALWHNEKHATALTAADFHSYEFHKVWGGEASDSKQKVEAFLDTDHFLKLAPLADAATTLRSLLPYFRFRVVTSRQHVVADKTRAWLFQHFEGIFEDVVFGNAYGDGPQRSKADICRDIGAVALIDDNEVYAAEVARACPPALGAPSAPGTVILFGEYPWNASAWNSTVHRSCPSTGRAPSPLPGNVVRALNWRHAHAILAAMRPGGAPHHRGGEAGGDGADGGGGGAPAQPLPFTPLRPRDSVAVAASAQGGMPGSGRDHRGAAAGSGGWDAGDNSVQFFSDQVRRVLEVQDSVAITGSGEDVRLVGLTADALTRASDVRIVLLRTGADGAPPGKPRYPRLTITLQRTPSFLRNRFHHRHHHHYRGGATAAPGHASAPAAGGEAAGAGAGDGGVGTGPDCGSDAGDGSSSDSDSDSSSSRSDSGCLAAAPAAATAETSSAALSDVREEVVASLSEHRA